MAAAFSIDFGAFSRERRSKDTVEREGREEESFSEGEQEEKGDR